MWLDKVACLAEVKPPGGSLCPMVLKETGRWKHGNDQPEEQYQLSAAEMQREETVKLVGKGLAVGLGKGRRAAGFNTGGA